MTTPGAPNFEAAQMVGRRLGRYEVLTPLASGGMATIYIARAQGVAGFERLVAIKLLHPHLAYKPEFISMFLDEARIAARIRHPNVVPTLDISDSEGDGFFLVMEYIEGDHLGSLLIRSTNRGKRLARPVVFRVISDALQGLRAAHELTGEDGEPLKLVHRDVSPQNILIGTDGISRLTDFGVAKAEMRMSSTQTGHFKGKMAYMTPEQISSGKVDQRSDLFSMGIILWESLTGRRLFRGESSGMTLNNVQNAPIPLPSELSADLAGVDSVVMKALARNPAERYQSAEEFYNALEQIADRYGIASHRDVADAVVELTAKKLQEERDRVRIVTEKLGRAQTAASYTPLRRDCGHTPLSGDYPTPPMSGSFSGRLSPIVVQAESDSKLLKAIVALLVALIIGVGYTIWGPSDSEPVSPQTEATVAKTIKVPATEEPKAEKPSNAKRPALVQQKPESVVDVSPTGSETTIETPNEETIENDDAPAAKRRRTSSRRRSTAQIDPEATPSDTPATDEPTKVKSNPGTKKARQKIDLVNPYRR